jgi:sortase A
VVNRAVRAAVAVAASAAVTYAGFIWYPDYRTHQEAAAVVAEFENQPAVSVGPDENASTSVAPSPEGYAKAPKKRGVVIGVLHVPRFGEGWSYPIEQGTEAEQLEAAVGHYVTSAMPGEGGPVALAGHRTTNGKPFWNIDELRAGDLIKFQTRYEVISYRVTGHKIVKPSQGEVLRQADLVMTACHPKFSSAQRYAVFAEEMKP